MNIQFYHVERFLLVKRVFTGQSNIWCFFAEIGGKKIKQDMSDGN